MKSYVAIVVLGLFSQQVVCQINPAMLALMSQGGAGGMAGSPLALAGMGMGNEMADLMMLQALSNSGGGGGAGGGAGGGSGGGFDPSLLLMMSGGAMGGAGGADMLGTMLMMEAMRGGNSGGGGGGGAGGPPGQGPPGQGGFHSNIASMLGDSGSGISPDQQTQLWQFLNMRGLSQRIMDAVQSPVERVQLERDGLIPNAEPGLTMAMNAACPRPKSCQFAFCETTEVPFTPESYYMCRGCPRCRLETNQQSMVNMMGQLGGTGGQGMSEIAQQMAMMRALGGGGGGGNNNPLMTLALMRQMQQRQQQTSPAQPDATQPAAPPMGSIGPRPQWTPPAGFPGATAPKPAQTPVQAPPAAAGGPPKSAPPNIARPPPEFIAMMKQMGQQMRAARTGPKQMQVPPSGSPPSAPPSPAKP